MKQLPRIAVLLATDMGASRAILRGIRRYAEGGSPWIFRVAWPLMTPVKEIGAWSPSGIIAKLFTQPMINAIRRLRKPVVNISNISGNVELPRVAADEAAIGRLAAKHFLERGFRHFAFLGYLQQNFPNDRGDAFRIALEKEGHRCHMLTKASLPTLRPGGMWGGMDPRVREWIVSLPKPVGLFAYQDYLAWEVAEICHGAGIHVPEEVALLGADDDELFCEMAHPKLSSIAYPAERIGFEAARVMDGLLQGKKPPRAPLLLPPQGVVTRQSSDIVAMEDIDLATAVRFIRQHAHEAIGVKHILQQVPISRRSLEQKFRKTLQRTPQEEISRVRIERAQQLLSRTELAMTEIARMAGFSNAERLSVVFKQKTGFSPTLYRAKFGSPR